MPTYRTFRRFDDVKEAETFSRFLQANGIPATFEKVPQLLDSTIIGFNPVASVEVKVPEDRFTAALRLIREQINIDLDKVEPDYYLLSFSDKELLDIVHHPDEWGDYDQALAVALLNHRGIPITEEQVEALEVARIEDLAQPRRVPDKTLLWVYFCGIAGVGSAMLLRSILAPRIGFYSLTILVLTLVPIVSGITFMTGRRTLPDGRSVPLYDARARQQGMWMIILFGVAVLLQGWYAYSVCFVPGIL